MGGLRDPRVVVSVRSKSREGCRPSRDRRRRVSRDPRSWSGGAARTDPPCNRPGRPRTGRRRIIGRTGATSAHAPPSRTDDDDHHTQHPSAVSNTIGPSHPARPATGTMSRHNHRHGERGHARPNRPENSHPAATPTVVRRDLGGACRPRIRAGARAEVTRQPALSASTPMAIPAPVSVSSIVAEPLPGTACTRFRMATCTSTTSLRAR